MSDQGLIGKLLVEKLNKMLKNKQADFNIINRRAWEMGIEVELLEKRIAQIEQTLKDQTYEATHTSKR